MATIGQIVYNVDGVENTAGFEDLQDFVGKNIIELATGSNQNEFIKLSVQSEPGVGLLINGNQIIIGRTGIYELDERVVVTELQIQPIKKYQKDEEATENAKQKALDIFSGLETGAYLEGEDLEKWIKDYKEDIESFNSGYISYLQGKNGIYVPVTNDNNEEVYEDLHNLIIDYVFQNKN